MKNKVSSLRVSILAMNEPEKMTVISFLQGHLDDELLLVDEDHADIVLVDMDEKNARIK